MADIVYIHYGSDHFYPEFFSPVRNGGWKPKPADRTGLWGSRVDDEFGWESWCRRNRFKTDSLDTYFKFTLPEAHILTLTDPSQLIDLPKLHPWKPKEPPKVEYGQLPTLEQLEEWFLPNQCYLDFERLAEEYDAVELRNSDAFNDALATWDCDSILVLKADKVREVREIEENA